MYCRHCGKEIADEDTSCPACGQPVGAEQDQSSNPLSMEDMYRAYVGPAKAHYYLPIFQRFDDEDNLISWNWPAAFFTSYWMIYRSMLLWGIVYYPLLSLLAGFILYFPVSMLMGAATDNYYSLLTYLIAFGVMGLFSNKLYHGHVHKMIEKSQRLGLTGQQQHDWLAHKGASKLWVIILVLVIIVLIGILAAIALPAYQDYVLRAREFSA